MADDRRWMYDGWKNTGMHTREWMVNTQAFVDFVFSSSPSGGLGKCPCRRCHNFNWQYKTDMERHLCKWGFMPDYLTWYEHGEPRSRETSNPNECELADDPIDALDDMMHDFVQQFEDVPGPEVDRFFSLLKASEDPLHESTSVTQLATVTRLMAIRSKYNFSVDCFNDLVDLISDILPKPHKLPKDFYYSKKLLAGLGMPYQKIDVCVNNCILFWKEHEKLDRCPCCKKSRYAEVVNKDGIMQKTSVPLKLLRYLPLTARLQRLYLSKTIAKHMRWHKEGIRTNEGYMGHPSDGEAWKALDRYDQDFASDPRNVRIGLATDGFTPFNTNAATYSCWPVFAIPYNLPPSLCMKDQYVFLTIIIPGPDHPGKHLDMFMQPLIDELKELWIGVRTYDNGRKDYFNMRAAFLWSIHDFPAYGMFSGWSTHGRLCCPICMDDTDAFRLKNGGKFCFFDCHRRFTPSNHLFRTQRNAFRKDTTISKGPPKCLTGSEIVAWHDRLEATENGYKGFKGEHNWTHISSIWSLPYVKCLILWHNIDVMHQERNVAESIISTVFDFKDKTKDNMKARRDMADICDRPTLEVRTNQAGRMGKPRAPYCLKPSEKKEVLAWLKNLKFPDGYASNLKGAVNIVSGKINGLKSHDYHIIMERLLPVMFRGYLKEEVWIMLAELSYFYRQLCAKEIKKTTMRKLGKEIPVLICKMEKVFPPGFMNVMQHLLVHLPYEAEVGGPVQYRWMYPIERNLKKIRATVGNKARVEGCIAQAFYLKEISYYTSTYFAEEHNINAHIPRYHTSDDAPASNLKIFQWKGKAVGGSSVHEVSTEEWNAAMLYMYTNIEEMDEYFE